MNRIRTATPSSNKIVRVEMGYTYDKDRKSYMVRVTYEGKRIHVGRYKTITQAKEAELAAMKRLKLLTTYTLDSYPMNRYEAQDSGISWLKPFRKLRQARRQKRLEKRRDAETTARLEKL